MKTLLFIIVIMLVVVHIAATSTRKAHPPRRSTFLLSVILSVIIYLQIYFMTPPLIDYWRTGWLGTIRVINIQLQQRGFPLYLPEPGGQ
jgi:hypothetical protein